MAGIGNRWLAVAPLAALLLCASHPADSQVVFTNTTTADAFLATGSPSNPDGSDLTGLNFGAAGTLAIAPPSAAKGEFQSVIQFDLSGAIPLFNSTYGSNHWTISAISLDLTSNYGTQGVQPNNGIFNMINGGQFVIEWLSTNGWPEGTGTPNLPTMDGVTYDSLSDLLSHPHKILCTNTYTPPGDNVHVIYPLPLDTNILADLTSGQLSLHFYAADNQIGYLFNSHSYGRGNQPLIHITANPLLQILSSHLTNGAFQLTGSIPTNSQCTIQVVTNLISTNWQTVGTATSDSNGAIQFNDPIVPNQPRHFYRLTR